MDLLTPTKNPRRGPNCGAPTPTPVAVANFVDLVQRVDDIESGGQRAGTGQLENVAQAQIDWV